MNRSQFPRARACSLLRCSRSRCALAAAPADAEKADREKPINFTADTGDVNYQTKIGVARRQRRSSRRARSRSAPIASSSSRTRTTRCRPPPTAIRSRFRQKRDGFDEYYEGFAQRVEYDGAKEFVELFDRALLQRGQDEIRSNYISYNSATEIFKAEGRPGSIAAPTRDQARACAACSSRSPTRRPADGRRTRPRRAKRRRRLRHRAPAPYAEARGRARSDAREMSPMPA